MKILNCYAGIGGNRKLWGNEHEITAVELDPEIANIYKIFFPNDNVIVDDAHKYLEKHYSEFDFIWASPPCPTHSRMNFLSSVQEGKTIKCPDMTLYSEIIFLKYWFKGKYCIENVISYYDPLIEPIKSNNHYFWTNFLIPTFPNETRGIRKQDKEYRENLLNINLDKFDIPKSKKVKLINNCVEPETGLHILNCALVPGYKNEKEIQQSLF